MKDYKTISIRLLRKLVSRRRADGIKAGELLPVYWYDETEPVFGYRTAVIGYRGDKYILITDIPLNEFDTVQTSENGLWMKIELVSPTLAMVG